MSVELFLPCVRFAIRLRPGRDGAPTDLETAILHYLKAVRTATLHDLCDFTGLGEPLLADLLIDMLNRRWVQITKQGALLLSDALERIMNSESALDLSMIGSTEVGERFVLCYDLIDGEIGYVPRHLLLAAPPGDAVVPRVRGFAEGGVAGYPKGLEGFDPVVSGEDPTQWSARILRALQTHAVPRERIAGLNLANCSVTLERPRRPLDHAVDGRFYRAAFDVLGTVDSRIEDLTIDYPGREPVAAIRRFARSAARRLTSIAALQAQDLADKRMAPFADLLRSAVTTHSHARTSAPSAFELFLLQLEKAQEDMDADALRDTWHDVRRRVEVMMASRIDHRASCHLDGADFLGVAKTLAAEARQEIFVASSRTQVRSPALTTDPDSLLEHLAARSDPRRSVDRQCRLDVVLPTPIDRADQEGSERIRLRLAERCHVTDPGRPTMATPLMAFDARTLLFLDGAPFGEHPPGGLLVVPQDARAGAVTPMLGPLMRSPLVDLAQDGRVPFRDGQDADGHPGLPDRTVRDVLGALDEVEGHLGRLIGLAHDDSGGLPDPGLVEDIRTQADWLWKWAQRDSESAELIDDASLPHLAARLMRADAPFMAIGLAGPLDRDAIDELPRRLRERLGLIEGEAGGKAVRALHTVVALPAPGEEQATRLAAAVREIREDFAPAGGARTNTFTGNRRIGFVLAGGRC